MSRNIVFLSLPGLRAEDVDAMPNLQSLTRGGDRATLVPSFPCVTWPVQANMLCGVPPDQHGAIANGFYWRDRHEFEMWTAGNDALLRPQIWDIMHDHDADLTSAAWFPMLSKRSGADYVCMPAPVHNPDGSESLWCYTKPTEYYGDLLEAHGHFPLQHFWGPMANIKSSAWIAESAVDAAARFQPNFFYIYITHLDYAAQRMGPDSEEAQKAVTELDELIGKLADGMNKAYDAELTWIVASEYTIVPVDHVTYPNRVLRESGLLEIAEQDGGEHIDLEKSRAWALVDHQFSHVFVRGADSTTIAEVVELFQGADGIAEVLSGDDRKNYHLVHERSGEVVLISTPNSWQAYYYWLDDALAPKFARTVDIHNKPGYDPVEMHFDPATKGIPLDATLVKGSHGAPAESAAQRGVVLCSDAGTLNAATLADVDMAAIVLGQFGIQQPSSGGG